MGAGATPAGLDRTGNLLGALSLAISDRTTDALGDAVGRSGAAAVALSALDQFLSRSAINRVSRVLGVSHSGAVRLIDNLERAGYVERKRSPDDARALSIVLTSAGRRAAARVETARAEVLVAALSGLNDTEREALGATLSRILVGLIQGPGASRWTCRLCDLEACGRHEGHCPVANEARRRYAGGSNS